MFRNKLDEGGRVARNKARLVPQWYRQKERIDYDETFAPIARIQTIHLLIAFATRKDFKLYQMDVKISFFNGHRKEEVYVAQPLSFESEKFLDHAYFLEKTMVSTKHHLSCLMDTIGGP